MVSDKVFWFSFGAAVVFVVAAMFASSSLAGWAWVARAS